MFCEQIAQSRRHINVLRMKLTRSQSRSRAMKGLDSNGKIAFLWRPGRLLGERWAGVVQCMVQYRRNFGTVTLPGQP
jgi:hypothetical protein